MMSRKKWFALLILVLIFSMVAAACGGDDDDDGDDNGGGDAALSQTFESSSGITIKYPEGWVARDGDSGIEIANSQAAFDAMDAEGDENDEIPEDGFALLIMNPADMALPGMENLDAKGIVGMIAGFMADEGEDEGMQAGEMEDAKVGDWDAGKVPVTDSSLKAEGFIIGYKYDDTTAVIAIALAREGELGDYEDTAIKMLESVTYTAPAGESEEAEG